MVRAAAQELGALWEEQRPLRSAPRVTSDLRFQDVDRIEYADAYDARLAHNAATGRTRAEGVKQSASFAPTAGWSKIAPRTHWLLRETRGRILASRRGRSARRPTPRLKRTRAGCRRACARGAALRTYRIERSRRSQGQAGAAKSAKADPRPDMVRARLTGGSDESRCRLRSAARI